MNNKHYDMILFENYHDAYHHKYDVVLIARLLQHGGLNVAILDIYQEEEADEIKGIPIIHLNGISKLFFGKGFQGNKILAVFRLIPFYFKRENYFRRVFSEVSDMTDSFYCGSYNMWMSTYFFHLNLPCFYWGLRSSRMNFKLPYIWRENPFSVRYIWLKKYFMRNPMQCLFVSNEIIRKEFVDNGVPESRIILREERCVEIEEKPIVNGQSPQIRFLTIGKLREGKQVTQTIKAFQMANISNSELFLVGQKSNDDYEKKLQKSIREDRRIHRVDGYLEYEAFNAHMVKSHFVVFADRQQMSSITNGTFIEALINRRPVIAPDYPPFNYFIHKYKLGLLYIPNNLISYSHSMQIAALQGTNSFTSAIDAFLKDISFEQVSQRLTKDVLDFIFSSRLKDGVNRKKIN